MENSDNIHDDSGINVAKLLNSVGKRKKIIIGVMVLIVGLTLALILGMGKVYESKAEVAIGFFREILPKTIEDMKSLESVVDLQKRLMSKYDNLSAVEIIGENLILIRGEGSSAISAHQYVKKIVRELIDEHEIIYRKIMMIRQKRLARRIEKAEKLKQDIQALSGPPGSKSSLQVQDSAVNLIALMERIKLQDELSLIEEKMFVMQKTTESKPTQVITEPTLPLKPVRPKTFKYLMLAVILGLAAGIFAAFCDAFRVQLVSQLNTNDQ